MEFHDFLHEVLLHGVVDTLKLVPFLFITYLIMEFIEHKVESVSDRFMRRSGMVGPLIGSVLGIIPQCGFSSTAANLFGSGLITMGTLIAVFLSTSDEMIPILLSSSVELITVVNIVVYKVIVSLIIGFVVDRILKLVASYTHPIQIDNFCEDADCRCEEENNIWKCSLRHTATITIFVLVVTLLLNMLIFFVGEDSLATIVQGKPFLSHFISSIMGLIPNCATSVILSTLYVDGIISVGTMISGLLTGSGVGLLVLLKIHKHKKENIFIVLTLILVGCIFGIVADIPFVTALLT